jgi:hypothetical protein
MVLRSPWCILRLRAPRRYYLYQPANHLAHGTQTQSPTSLRLHPEGYTSRGNTHHWFKLSPQPSCHFTWTDEPRPNAEWEQIADKLTQYGCVASRMGRAGEHGTHFAARSKDLDFYRSGRRRPLRAAATGHEENYLECAAKGSAIARCNLWSWHGCAAYWEI